jgi:DNA invertase Pin-like site-specific DNA recombinase
MTKPHTPASGQLLGYARCSTKRQDPTLQHDALTAAGCQRIWTDVASGRLAARPELDGCLDHLRPGDTLVVWKLDRLGRSVQHLAATICDLNERGVDFVSLTEGFDTRTPAGRLLCHVLSAIAEFESDIIKERVNAGLEVARDQGRVGGRPTVMSTEKAEAARALIDGGKSVVAAAKAVGVSRATLYRHLDLTPIG